MDFVAIDFETATSDRDSPCEIGLTFVSSNRVVHTQSWLIRPRYYPYFNPFNIGVHGIRPEDVAQEPEFDELWQELRPHLDNRLVIAHNASFDMSVLRKTLETYRIPFPSLQYSCSYLIAKKAWPGLTSYGLKALCQYHNIALQHHRAGADSLACAQLALRMFEQHEIHAADDLPRKLSINVGRLFEGGYHSSGKVTPAKRSNLTVSDPAKRRPDSLFYGRTVVFTGTLSGMPRNSARQQIADIGGRNADTLGFDTDFLVVGQKVTRSSKESGVSSKLEKARQLIRLGARLVVLSEEEFLKNL